MVNWNTYQTNKPTDKEESISDVESLDMGELSKDEDLFKKDDPKPKPKKDDTPIEEKKGEESKTSSQSKQVSVSDKGSYTRDDNVTFRQFKKSFPITDIREMTKERYDPDFNKLFYKYIKAMNDSIRKQNIDTGVSPAEPVSSETDDVASTYTRRSRKERAKRLEEEEESIDMFRPLLDPIYEAERESSLDPKVTWKPLKTHIEDYDASLMLKGFTHESFLKVLSDTDTKFSSSSAKRLKKQILDMLGGDDYKGLITAGHTLLMIESDTDDLYGHISEHFEDGLPKPDTQKKINNCYQKYLSK
jgi:hypothetical protein